MITFVQAEQLRAEKFATLTRPAPGKHMTWAGPSTKKGVPIVHAHGIHTARSVAFRIAYNRQPVGQVRPFCGQAWCVAPEHVADTPLRTELRELLAKEQGRDLTATECDRGHPTDEHRRFWSDGKPYCSACHYLTSRALLVSARRRKNQEHKYL